MGNIFRNFNVGLRYDLKGSTQGRTLLASSQKPQENKNLKVALKDNDFIKHVKKLQFDSHKASNTEFLWRDNKEKILIDILNADADFL